jgi:hypothetical protein
MTTPQLLSDIANVMLLLAPSAAVLCLVLAGISLRQETSGVNFAIGGGFTKWMFWAVVFVTLPGLLTWFSSSGVNVPSLGGGISSSWLSTFQTDVSGFVQNLVVARMVLAKSGGGMGRVPAWTIVDSPQFPPTAHNWKEGTGPVMWDLEVIAPVCGG